VLKHGGQTRLRAAAPKMGRRTKLRMGQTLATPGQRLRRPLENPRLLSLPRVRVPHAQQNLQNAQLKSLTASKK
jgi:hypothetical protein